MSCKTICRSFGTAVLCLQCVAYLIIPVAANSQSCPVSIFSGQPACDEPRDVGSNAPDPTRSHHVGNPVDVVSGNKYQSEQDVRLGGSALSLVRHYNSLNSATNIGLGNGWRHTYSVALIANGNNVRQVIQSDGRLIEFRFNGSVFQSLNDEDGYVLSQSDKSHTWHLPDGRVLSFYGSFLTNISIADGSSLSLYYKRSRLHSVTDELGRSIVFRYAPGSPGLPSYEPATDEQPAGHLIAIVLPDGSLIDYHYDNRHNLAAVSYPRVGERKDGHVYRYKDALNSGLLTERANSYGKALARWSYNDAGRVVSYRNGAYIRADGSTAGTPDLTMSYAAGDEKGSGTTVITDRDGAQTFYQWKLDDNHRVSDVAQRETQPSEEQAEINRLDDSQTDAINEHLLPQQVDDILTVLELDELGYPRKIEYLHSGETEPDQLAVKYNQLGELMEVNWQSGVIRAVNEERRITRQELSDFVNARWEAGIATQELLAAIAQRGYIESSARMFLMDSTKALEVGTRISAGDLAPPWSAHSSSAVSPRRGVRSRVTGHPFTAACSDPLKDCVELLKARDYAEIADCAYVDSLCHTRFIEADLDELGITWDNLVEGSFRAGIYHDRERDSYIVTFAGTKFTSIDDWINNARQEFGKYSEQYALAVDLARLLVRKNPDLSFSFTGHSLGGGLATAAAAATGLEATVFNPAALSRETASILNFNYSDTADTQVYSVEGELLSHLQNEYNFTNRVLGSVHSLRRPDFQWVQSNVRQNPLWAYQTRLGAALHEIGAVRKSLAELVERYNCE